MVGVWRPKFMNNIPHCSPAAAPSELRLPGGWSLSWHRAALVVIAALVVYRLWYVTRLELIADEAYYFLWAKHLDWSYFSKGPGVATVIWLGTRLFGDTVFGIRFFSVLLSAGTGYCLYRLGRKLFDGQVGFFALLLAVITPLFAIGGVLMTIDPISMFFWAAAALAFWRAKDEEGVGFWLLTGLLVGLGMLGKYTNVAQLFCFLLFCATSPLYRRCLRRKNFWLMIVVALLCLTPVLIWNYQNHWVTFEHLWHRGALDSKWHFSAKEFLKFIGGQGAAYSPLLFIGVIAAAVAGTWRVARAEKPDPRVHYLVALFWPLFLFYALLSLNKAAEANWTVPSYFSGFPLAVFVWRKWVNLSRPLAWFAVAGAVMALLMTAALQLGAWYPATFLKKDPMDRVRGWSNLGSQVYDLQKAHGATFVIGSDYGLASLISFYLPHKPQTYMVNVDKIENQYGFWSNYSDGFGGESAIFVSSRDHIPERLLREFARVELLKESYTVWRGRNIKKFYFYLCSDFGGNHAANGEVEQ